MSHGPLMEKPGLCNLFITERGTMWQVSPTETGFP